MSTTTMPPHQTQLLCTRCENHFLSSNNGLIICPDCHQRDIDFTIDFGNQVQILQIDVSLRNISSNYHYDSLEKLVAQLEKEKRG
jgi:hypothetical protein